MATIFIYIYIYISRQSITASIRTSSSTPVRTGQSSSNSHLVYTIYNTCARQISFDIHISDMVKKTVHRVIDDMSGRAVILTVVTAT